MEGDVVRGASHIDAHDREIIAWRAVMNAGISGSDIHDLLEAIAAVLCPARAGVHEVLTDNGGSYIAKDTQIFVRQLGLKPCFTPVRSPQSNSMSEVIVKTLKRYYVQVTPLTDAASDLSEPGSQITTTTTRTQS